MTRTAALLALLAACVRPSVPSESGRYLVYFDEFSADLSPQALQIVADAAQGRNVATLRSQAGMPGTSAPIRLTPCWNICVW